MSVDLRNELRKDADYLVELTWKTEAGEKRIESCRAVNLSEDGVAVECPETIPMLTHVVVRAPTFEVAALAQVKHCTWRRTIYVLGLSFVAKTSTLANDPMSPDHYEILRLSADADQETIERVYRTLARRFHPDNDRTGDAEIFLRIAEAHRILCDPGQRRRYDAHRESQTSVVRFDMRSRDFFAGLRGEQNRRLAVLCLLYRKRTADHDRPGLSLLDLECLSGFTREELGFALWYVCEKGLARVNDHTKYEIRAEGCDYLESRLTDEHADLRVIAALQIPNQGHGPKPMMHVNQ